MENRSSSGLAALAGKMLILALFSAAAGWFAALKANFGTVPGIVIGTSIFGAGVFAILKLAGSPRELWLTMMFKFLSGIAYKLLNLSLVYWLTRDIGMTEAQSGVVILVWGFCMSGFTLLVGSVTDAIGVRRTLILGVSLCLLTRLIMLSASNQWVVLLCGLLPLAAGEALCTPVLVAALRKFAAPAQRTVAFSLFYALLNLGFMTANFSFDGVRQATGESGLALPWSGVHLGEARTLILVSLGVELLILPLLFFIRPGAEMTDAGLRLTPQEPRYPGAGMMEALRRTVADAARDTVSLFARLLQQPDFYRLLAFLFLIGFLKVVFQAADYVLPKFADRELGAGAPVGRFNAINGILILILAPAVGLMTRKLTAYTMVVAGSVVTALSFVFMVLPPDSLTGIADSAVGRWIGHGYLGLSGAINPWCLMIVAWQIVFSLGEAMYSPRVYEYAASIAPKGQEASYASLSYIPLLIGKIVTGSVFGGLLAKYCPETGPRDSGTMWLILGSLVLIAPVGLISLRRYIRVQEEGRS